MNARNHIFKDPFIHNENVKIESCKNYLALQTKVYFEVICFIFKIQQVLFFPLKMIAEDK